MLDIKECRKIKRDYTKNNEGKNIIVNIEGFPLCYMVITHGNGKSWGYFFEHRDSLFLGTANQEINYANCKIQNYNPFLSTEYEVKLLGGNEIIKSAYERFFKYIYSDCHYYKNYKFSTNLRRLFEINPILFANLTDSGVFEYVDYKKHLFGYFYCVDLYSKYFNYSKPLIKQAFGMSAKWVKLLFSIYDGWDQLKLFRKYNYTVEEIQKLHDNCAYFGIPDELLPNKELTFKYTCNRFYKDYYNMRRQLSNETQRNFPLNPKDVKKYHDKIVGIYNREQAFKRKKELEKKQTAYNNNVYNNAVKYNFEDDTYFIKACKELTDLLIEGSTLHHCVGSYVNSVSEGREYILFLRKVSEPDTPYFTIDVTPSGQVRQIHGLYNCNMGDDIKPFVEIWAKKFKLNLEGCSGVRCALH